MARQTPSDSNLTTSKSPTPTLKHQQHTEPTISANSRNNKVVQRSIIRCRQLHWKHSMILCLERDWLPWSPHKLSNCNFSVSLGHSLHLAEYSVCLLRNETRQQILSRLEQPFEKTSFPPVNRHDKISYKTAEKEFPTALSISPSQSLCQDVFGCCEFW